MMLIPFVFIVLRVFEVILRIQQLTGHKPNKTLLVLMSFCNPSQGISNFVVFMLLSKSSRFACAGACAGGYESDTESLLESSAGYSITGDNSSFITPTPVTSTMATPVNKSFYDVSSSVESADPNSFRLGSVLAK
eukprot:CAMPEP_0175124408 /NCGR_PEP_ID=MMETSP0087-20121206/2763_1 /TAXON_ID=136419 /ORGANISM="Unknown Unknown, Strain D1" /LENGTH=134 /DNA_ID=CAMNT_0016406169 /DNA_START=557 /DNA_END=964 /DNA_ORIENTATION=-